MKRIGKWAVILLICCSLLPANGFAKELVAVGQVIGLELQDGTVTVSAFDEELGDAAKAAGLQVGDQIVSIDGKPICCASDVRKALDCSRGVVSICVKRNKETKTCEILPAITAEGPKLGLYLRQGVTGIGTVTWYDPETGDFGTLGHGVENSAGQLVTLTRGNAYQASVNSVCKGKSGNPGRLMGTAASHDYVGLLQRNTARGVFGNSETGWNGKRMETASWEEVTTGNATILSTVSGSEVREYSVEILKIYPKAQQSGRNLLLKVTDPALLDATGGIVQGMSGSPIIQNGKLVGAVTHVLVNDPTTGYGIFIENMLNAAA